MRLESAERFAASQGWKARVTIIMKKARVEVKTNDAACIDWVTQTLAPGMTLRLGPLNVWDRLVLALRRQALTVPGYAPVVGPRERKRFPRRQRERFDYSLHEVVRKNGRRAFGL